MIGRRVRRILGQFRRQPAPAPEGRIEEIEVALGSDFSDLTSAELCEHAVAEGRIESFLLIGEAFGGEPTGPNVILGPIGSAAVKARIDEEIGVTLRTGGSVNLRAGFRYDDGKSLVPRTITFALGDLGTRVLRLW